MRQRIIAALVIFFTIRSHAQTWADTTGYVSAIRMADSCYSIKDTANARHYWQKALSIRPWSCKARNGMMMLMGSVLCNCDDNLGALEYHRSKGKEYFKMKEYNNAKTEFIAAHEITPSTPIKR